MTISCIRNFDSIPTMQSAGSPEIMGYRNKCEFAIGQNFEGLKSVGFMSGPYTSGKLTVVVSLQFAMAILSITY
jgi:hypothetical protein